MKIALAAARHKNKDMEFNISRMESFMLHSRSAGAELVCFGETFLQGFDCFDWCYESDKDMAVPADSELFDRVCSMSASIGIDVLFGFAEREGESIFSSAALVADGEVRRLYRRLSRGWKEYSRTDGHYREGDRAEVFEYRGRKCAIALCGDLWDFPERFALGEDILFWPVYVSYTPREWNGGVMQEYAEQAAEACGTALFVNSICEDDAHGGAALFKDGCVSDSLDMDREDILLVEV